jgi:hypothetical protein
LAFVTESADFAIPKTQVPSCANLLRKVSYDNYQ